MLGDKGYNPAAFIEKLAVWGIQAVIPSHFHRLNPRACDWHLYKELHLVECFFNKIKYYRRIFGRFEKIARHFMAFLIVATTLIWTR